jgi:hypothetical protein
MDLMDRTIIYYTANQEDVVFEQKIIDDLREKAGEIPIISVSRKPIDLGINICIGEQAICYTNEWRQLLIGLKAAKTRFCITAESDCLYPSEYFRFTPPVDNKIYYYENLWLVWKNHNGYWKKTGHCEGAEMCGREYWISRIEPLLGEGWKSNTREWENKTVKEFFPEEGLFNGDPVISFKTGKGVSCRSTFINEKIKNIPYWGEISKLKQKYLWEI